MSKVRKPITIQPLKPKTRNQAQYLDLIKKKKLVICIGPAGSGKAQPLNSIVYTILPKNKRVDLKKFGEFLAEIEDVGFVELNNEDIIREEIVSEILEKLEEWK